MINGISVKMGSDLVEDGELGFEHCAGNFLYFVIASRFLTGKLVARKSEDFKPCKRNGCSKSKF